jgi:hypothetical protein
MVARGERRHGAGNRRISESILLSERSPRCVRGAVATSATTSSLVAGRSGVEGVLNISTGRETSVRNLAHRRGLTTRFASHRPGEVAAPAWTRRPPVSGSAGARTSLAEGLERTLRAVERPRDRA